MGVYDDREAYRILGDHAIIVARSGMCIVNRVPMGITSRDWLGDNTTSMLCISRSFAERLTDATSSERETFHVEPFLENYIPEGLC